RLGGCPVRRAHPPGGGVRRHRIRYTDRERGARDLVRAALRESLADVSAYRRQPSLCPDRGAHVCHRDPGSSRLAAGSGDALNLVRKKQLVVAGLIGFTLWPLAQMALVHRFGISPWKLAGWGMYATPRFSPGIGILVQHAGEEPAPIRDVPPAIRVACENFAPRRTWLHDLAPPDAIGALVLASNPDYERATVVILEPKLDTKTGMVRTDEKLYRYDRRADRRR